MPRVMYQEGLYADQEAMMTDKIRKLQEMTDKMAAERNIEISQKCELEVTNK